MKTFKEYLEEAPFTFRGNAKVHFAKEQGKGAKFAKVACGIKAGTRVITGTVEASDVTCGKCITYLKREGLIEDDTEEMSTADRQRENYMNKFLSQLEDAPANSVSGGGVDMAPNAGKKKKKKEY